MSIEPGRPVAGERALEQETDAYDNTERHHERSDDSDGELQRVVSAIGHDY